MNNDDEKDPYKNNSLTANHSYNISENNTLKII